MWPSSLPRHGHDGGEKNTSARLAGRQNAAFPTAHHGPPCPLHPLRPGLPPAAALPAERCGPPCPHCMPAAAALATKGRVVALPVALPAGAAAAALTLLAYRCGPR